MTKKTSGQITAKATRVEKLLSNKDLQQAFTDVRDALHKQFDQIAPSDLESMVKIKERLHLLISIEENLKQAIRDGRLEDFKVDEREKLPFLGDISAWRKQHKK